MKILFFTDNFPPESNAPASRTFEHVVRWVRSGHEVTIVTCAPNFPQGKLFAGYRNKLWQTEVMDGIRVVRLWSYIAPNSGVFKRTLDYLSFMIAAMIAAPFLARPDVIVGTSPQFFTLVAARWASFVKRRPWMLELRDIWPESIKAVGLSQSSALFRALQRLEMSLYRSASRIVVVTHSFKRILVQRGIPGDKIAVVTNGVDFSRYQPRAKDPELVRDLNLEDRFVAGYVGTHGMAHALETLLSAAQKMQARADLRDVVILFVGDGARRAELEAMAAKNRLDNVRFLGPVPKEAVARFWSVLDVSIIHLKNTELFTTTIPSKLFECMGMGLPVLLGVAGEAQEMVERHEIGLPFPPEDAESLVEGIATLFSDKELMERLRANATNTAPDYDRGRLAERMLRELEAASGHRVV
jgi:glycosyltransferase involved in cell wall biosynthesis